MKKSKEETLVKKVYFVYPTQIKRLVKVAKQQKSTPSKFIRTFIESL